MNANKLMLGDLVMIAHGGNATHYAKVTALLPEGTIECNLDGCRVLCKSVEPIPITQEILEKNFPDTEDGVLWWKDEDGMHIETETDGDMLFCGLFNYVHQFQHALRLAGIEKEIEP